MRPQQQNRRMRSRNNGGGGNNNNSNNNNNNNRKGPNPLTRNYESNGPDVKIRGSAQQIAEKYTTLARDSYSSGDRVMSENYLQHAEHYNRIIAAAQAQMPIQQTQNNRDDMDEEGEDDQFGFDTGINIHGNNGNGNQNGNSNGNGETYASPSSSPQQPMNVGSGPQPVIEGMPAEVALNSETPSQQQPRRERRPHVSQPISQPTGDVPAAGGQDIEAAAPVVEDAAAPRRGRRPRRGERSRDRDLDGSTEAGSDAEQPASGVELSDGAKALAAFEN